MTFSCLLCFFLLNVTDIFFLINSVFFSFMLVYFIWLFIFFFLGRISFHSKDFFKLNVNSLKWQNQLTAFSHNYCLCTAEPGDTCYLYVPNKNRTFHFKKPNKHLSLSDNKLFLTFSKLCSMDPKNFKLGYLIICSVRP